MLGIVFGAAALLFYDLLFKSKLVPRFISIWGLIAAAMVLAWHVLHMFGPGQGMALNMVLAQPITLNEILVGICLVVKGFDPAALPSEAVA